MRERKLALHKETLAELSSGDLRIVVGAWSGSCPCGTSLQTCVTCIDPFTVATCECPAITGPTCACPTQGCV